MLTTALIVIFALWLTATYGAQWQNPAARLLRRCDLLGLLPSWTFFAPKPGVFDYAIQYRDLAATTFGSWHALAETRAATWYSWFFNPGAVENKVLHDMIITLMDTYDRLPYPETIAYDPIYQAILRATLQRQPPPPSSRRQFRIILTQGPHRTKITTSFLSETHAGCYIYS